MEILLHCQGFLTSLVLQNKILYGTTNCNTCMKTQGESLEHSVLLYVAKGRRVFTEMQVKVCCHL